MSAGKSVEFEISVKEFNVKFKGDIQSAERMHGEIAGALTSLASAQRLLTAPPKPPPTPAIVTVEPAGRRRGRRRHTPVSAGTQAANTDGVAVPQPDAGADDGGTSRRSAGARGQSARLTQLKDEGFVSDGRTNAELRAVLAAKPYTVKPTERRLCG